MSGYPSAYLGHRHRVLLPLVCFSQPPSAMQIAAFPVHPLYAALTLISIIVGPLLRGPFLQPVERCAQAIEDICCMQNVVVVMPWRILQLALCHHRLHCLPGILGRCVMCVDWIFGAWLARFKAWCEVGIKHLGIVNNERLGIGIEIRIRIVSHTRQSVGIVAPFVVSNSRELGVIIITFYPRCREYLAVNRPALLSLIPEDDSQAIAAYSYITY